MGNIGAEDGYIILERVVPEEAEVHEAVPQGAPAIVPFVADADPAAQLSARDRAEVLDGQPA